MRQRPKKTGVLGKSRRGRRSICLGSTGVRTAPDTQWFTRSCRPCRQTAWEVKMPLQETITEQLRLRHMDRPGRWGRWGQLGLPGLQGKAATPNRRGRRRPRSRCWTPHTTPSRRRRLQRRPLSRQPRPSRTPRTSTAAAGRRRKASRQQPAVSRSSSTRCRATSAAMP